MYLKAILKPIQHADGTPSVAGGLKPPGGGAPPPTHSWRICDRGLVLAGVLGVLGNLGILGKNLENIAPERSQIEPRGLKNRAPGFLKSSPEASKTPFLKDT